MNNSKEQLEKIKQKISTIKKVNQDKVKEAYKHLDSLAKPPRSLGKLEDIAARIYGITEDFNYDSSKRCIIVASADHGIVEEGVSVAPQSVTIMQTINMLKGLTGVGVLAKQFNAKLFVADVGIKENVYYENLILRKIRFGTGNIAKEKAMNLEEVIKAVEVGIELVEMAKEEGYSLIGTGEMGIGNTSASSAILASILGYRDEEVRKTIGKGGGLTEEGYENKVNVITKAIQFHNPDKDDIWDILQKVGGLDIATIAGMFIGGAIHHIPVIIDGYISAVGALCAYKMNPNVKDYMFPSHQSFEEGYKLVMDQLELEPYINLDMRLGEGSGCTIMFGIIDGAISIFKNMATFEEANINDKYLDEIRKIDGFTLKRKENL